MGPFSPVMDVDLHPDHSSPVTFVQLFLNTVNHSYKLCCGKALFPYCVESLAMDFYPWYTFSPQKLYQWMLLFFVAYWKQRGHTNSAMTTLQLAGEGQKYSLSHRESVLLLAYKISSAATTRIFKINNCRNFLTHLHASIWRASVCIAWISPNKLYNKATAWGWW